MVAVGIFTVGSILQIASLDYTMLVIARLIGGIGIGMLSMVAPLHISEISPLEIRGALLVLEELSIASGIVIAYWITYGTRYMVGEWAWGLPFLLRLVSGLVLGIGILFHPFSPRWLICKGRNSEVLVALGRLRRLSMTGTRVQHEWPDILAEVAFHKETSMFRNPNLQGRTKMNRIKLELVSWADCFKRGGWRRTHIGIGLMFFQQFVGINALKYYWPILFETMGLDYSMQLIMSGVLTSLGLWVSVLAAGQWIGLDVDHCFSGVAYS